MGKDLKRRARRRVMMIMARWTIAAWPPLPGCPVWSLCPALTTSGLGDLDHAVADAGAQGRLVAGGRPVHDRWNFDAENREPPPRGVDTLGVPEPWKKKEA